MFCPKCGTELGEGARFCPRCGNEGGSFGSPVSGAVEAPRKRPKVIAWIAAGAVAVLVAVGAAFALGAFDGEGKEPLVGTWSVDIGGVGLMSMTVNADGTIGGEGAGGMLFGMPMSQVLSMATWLYEGEQDGSRAYAVDIEDTSLGVRGSIELRVPKSFANDDVRGTWSAVLAAEYHGEAMDSVEMSCTLEDGGGGAVSATMGGATMSLPVTWSVEEIEGGVRVHVACDQLGSVAVSHTAIG